MPSTAHRFRRKRAWISVLVSLVLHLVLVLFLGDFWREKEEAKAFHTRLVRPQRFEPEHLAAARPHELPQRQLEYLPSETRPQPEVPEAGVLPRPPALPALEAPEARLSGRGEVEVGAKADTFVSPEERMVTPGELARAAPQPTESMDLLRLEDLARANREHALLVPNLSSRRDLRGYINLTRLRLYGAGSDTAGAVDAVARYMRDHTRILARMRPRRYSYFLSEELLKDPVHFLLQGGGFAPSSDLEITHFSAEEYALMGRYLRGGGFLFIEGNYRYLREMVDHLHKILDGDGRMVFIPPSHPIYHSYYDFDSGFPGEDKDYYAAEAQGASPWFYPLYDRLDLVSSQGQNTSVDPNQDDEDTGQPPLGLWGVELGDELVAVLSDLDMSTAWRSSFNTEGDDQGRPAELMLQAAVNIIVYTMSRTQGVTPKREQSVWEHSRPPSEPLSLVGEEEGGGGGIEAEFDDADLLDRLDASLALVQAPLGSPIDKGGIRVLLDGRYSLELLKRGLHGLLLHNLPAGKHRVKLRYGGKSKELEVELEGGKVRTVTFGLNRIVFLTKLSMKQQKDLAGVAEWLQSFSDLDIEEMYLGGDQGEQEKPVEF